MNNTIIITIVITVIVAYLLYNKQHNVQELTPVSRREININSSELREYHQPEHINNEHTHHDNVSRRIININTEHYPTY